MYMRKLITSVYVRGCEVFPLNLSFMWKKYISFSKTLFTGKIYIMEAYLINRHLTQQLNVMSLFTYVWKIINMLNALVWSFNVNQKHLWPVKWTTSNVLSEPLLFITVCRYDGCTICIVYILKCILRIFMLHFKFEPHSKCNLMLRAKFSTRALRTKELPTELFNHKTR